MIGKLVSVENHPSRNVKITILLSEVFSEISSPSGSYASSEIDHYEVCGLREGDTGGAKLTLVLEDQRRVLFYCTESKFDMVLLLDGLDGAIGKTRQEARP